MPDAIAILFSGDPATGECSCDVFRASEGVEDPVLHAEGLRGSCQGDFPTRMWSIAANDAAMEIASERRLRWWGMT